MPYLIHRRKKYPHLGDCLMAGLVTAVLRDHGVDAVADVSHPLASRVLDVPVLRAGDMCTGWANWKFSYEPAQDYGHSYVEEALARFAKWSGTGPYRLTRTAVPVTWARRPGPAVDVALNTATSAWTPYRVWPHFPALKRMLSAAGVSWVDLDDPARPVRGPAALDVLERCRLYVGLDTGMSHLASQPCAGKGLILNGGYALARLWAVYDYEYLGEPTACTPCFKRAGCAAGHACLAGLEPARVFERILARLGR